MCSFGMIGWLIMVSCGDDARGGQDHSSLGLTVSILGTNGTG